MTAAVDLGSGWGVSQTYTLPGSGLAVPVVAGLHVLPSDCTHMTAFVTIGWEEATYSILRTKAQDSLEHIGRVGLVEGQLESPSAGTHYHP